MKESEEAQAAGRYIKTIKDPDKRRYAQRYFFYLLGYDLKPPSPRPVKEEEARELQVALDRFFETPSSQYSTTVKPSILKLVPGFKVKVHHESAPMFSVQHAEIDFGRKEITIRLWKGADEKDTLALLAHEVGHIKPGTTEPQLGIDEGEAWRRGEKYAEVWGILPRYIKHAHILVEHCETDPDLVSCERKELESIIRWLAQRPVESGLQPPLLATRVELPDPRKFGATWKRGKYEGVAEFPSEEKANIYVKVAHDLGYTAFASPLSGGRYSVVYWERIEPSGWEAQTRKYWVEINEPGSSSYVRGAIIPYQEFEVERKKILERGGKLPSIKIRHEPPPGNGNGDKQLPATTKEPWQITRGEYRNLQVRRPDGTIVGTWEDHESLVRKALSEGKPVPPEVLADYPDMKPLQTSRLPQTQKTYREQAHLIIEDLQKAVDETKKADSVRRIERILDRIDTEILDRELITGLNDIQDAIEDYKGIEKSGLTPEEYQEEKEAAFEAIAEVVDGLDIDEDALEEISREPLPGNGNGDKHLPATVEAEPIPEKYKWLIPFIGDEPLPPEADRLLPAVEVVEGERKIDAVLKRLAEGVEGIQDSTQFRLFLTTMAKFHDYSYSNQILIMLQKPNATKVAGFVTWKDLGRWVKRGEKDISILAPIFPPKPKKEEGEDEEEVTLTPVYFRVVSVFDISQTEGKPLPEFDVPVLTGEANEELFSKVLAMAKDQGLDVSFEPRPHMDPSIKGMYSAPKSIWVRPEESKAQQLKSLLHEIAHYYSEGVFRIPRRDAETIAESVAFAVGAHYGFDSGVRSFPYVALWAQEKKTLSQNLKTIRKVADTMLHVLEGTSKEKPAVIPTRPSPPSPREELEFVSDSPDFIPFTIDQIGYRDKLDNAFQSRIAQVQGIK